MTYRGVTKTGEVVEGDKFRTKCTDKPDIYHILIESREVDLTERYEEVYPESLALSTGITDKNGKMIYGSIEVNGNMSKGGDVVKIDNCTEYPVIYENCSFGFYQVNCEFSTVCDWGCRIEIIGSQWKGRK